MSEPLKIAVFLLGTYERTGWFTKEIVEFVYSLPYNMDYSTRFSVAYNFIPAAGARNFIANQVLKWEPQPDWVLMIDNDMAPPQNLLDTVKKVPPEADIVVPQFYLWDQDKKHSTLCWGMEKFSVVNGREVCKVEPGFQELSKCGTGVIFIRPTVFRKIPAPWFWYTYDDLQGMTATEDINFCVKAKEHGLRIFGNADIEVGHNHTCNISVIAEAIHGMTSQAEPVTQAKQSAEDAQSSEVAQTTSA